MKLSQILRRLAEGKIANTGSDGDGAILKQSVCKFE